MPALGLMLVQAPAEKEDLNVQGQPDDQNEKNDLDHWLRHFSKQLHNVF